MNFLEAYNLAVNYGKTVQTNGVLYWNAQNFLERDSFQKSLVLANWEEVIEYPLNFWEAYQEYKNGKTIARKEFYSDEECIPIKNRVSWYAAEMDVMWRVVDSPG
jgi:hypothetical protein